jgi:GlcNAc-P-P-Und epimerase
MDLTIPDSEGRYLITGSSGFIGTRLMGRLGGTAATLGLDLRPAMAEALQSKTRIVDVRDTASLKGILRTFRPSHIIHLAARTDFQGKTPGDYTSNTDGVASLLTAVRSLETPPIVNFVSTRYVHHPHHPVRGLWDYCPTNPYATSKVIGESLVRSVVDIPWVISRPTSIWGPGFGTPYRQFFTTVRRRLYVHAGHRQVIKTLGYVDNAVSQLIALTSRQAVDAFAPPVYYVGDYLPTDILEWARSIARFVQSPPPVHAPYALLWFIALSGSAAQAVTQRPSPLTLERLTNLYRSQVFDLSRTQSLAPGSMIDLQSATETTIRWLVQQS